MIKVAHHAVPILFSSAAILWLGHVYADKNESYFTCNGTIVIHGSSLPGYEEREQITAHIKDDKIFFSGNSLLGGGEDIQVCPAKTLDTSPDEYYFDSDSCSGSARNAERRYGTFNRISHKLILSKSHELTEKHGDTWLVEGKFDCISLNPER